MKRLLLLSGPIAVGKSSVAGSLIADFGFRPIKSSSYLRSLASSQGIEADRTSLQELGDKLDEETDFKWIVDDVAAPTIQSNPDCQRWLVDAVRKAKQIEHFRSKFGSNVQHVHLTASEATLADRYLHRSSVEGVPQISYGVAIAHPNEVAARGLITIADLCIDLDLISTKDAVALITR